MTILKKEEEKKAFIRALQEFVKKWNKFEEIDFAISYLNNVKIEWSIKGALEEHIEKYH